MSTVNLMGLRERTHISLGKAAAIALNKKARTTARCLIRLHDTGVTAHLIGAKINSHKVHVHYTLDAITNAISETPFTLPFAYLRTKM